MIGLTMLLAPALDMLYGEGGDEMRMIGHDVRESPEWHLTGLLFSKELVKSRMQRIYAVRCTTVRP